MRIHALTALALILSICASVAQAGPYSPGKGGPDEAGFIDAGIAGFIGPDGEGNADGANNYVNPYFAGWATGFESYDPSDQIGDYAMDWIPTDYGGGNPSDPLQACGPVTGNVMHVVCMGDRDADEIANGDAPGTLTLTFDKPIINGPGADFAAFENGFVSNYNTGAGSAMGEMFAELGFVEVSTNGSDFARFPADYLNHPDGLPGGDTDGDGSPNNIAYLTQDVSNLHNLAGKHANAYGESWGTPFDLDDLQSDPLVQSGTVNLNDINYVRILDIAGDGSTQTASGQRIFDAWVTWGTGGMDVEALGVIHQLTEDTHGNTQTVAKGGSTWGHWNDDGGTLDILFSDTARGDGTPVSVIAESYTDAGILDLLDGDLLAAWDVNIGDLVFEEDGGGILTLHFDPADYAGDGSDLAVFHYDGSIWESIGIADYDLLTGTVTTGSVDEFSPFALTVIPEPATMGLLGFGGLALLRRRRRNRCVRTPSHFARSTARSAVPLAAIALLLAAGSTAMAGDFSPGKGGPGEAGFIDAGIPGHIGGPEGPGDVDPDDGSYVNPVFKGWATGAVYQPSDQIGFYGQDGIPSNSFSNPASALGPATENSVLCLGDMDQSELDAWRAGTGHGPGTVTLSFDYAIKNGPGADFAAFENGFVSNYTTEAGSVSGEMWAELAYVEVSTDGSNFARFPSIYDNFLDGSPTTQDYLTLDVSNIYNLVGKHANAYGTSFGTPFDLDDLLDDQLVLDGLVDLDEINFVRLVDIPGDGSFTDSQGNAIYDAWLTWGTGGADIDAVGVINQVPEPATMALLGLGGLILGRRSRKTN